MNISTEVLSFSKYGNIFEILPLLKSSGFDAFDFTMFGSNGFDTLIHKDDYLDKAKKVREFADKINILCNQTHATFPIVRQNDEEYNARTFKSIIRSLEVSGILGAKSCIVHPCNDYSAEQNLILYEKLLPYAKKNKVKIALENMWNWDNNLGHAVSAACSNHLDFKKHLDLLDKEWFVACLDIGHSEMEGLNTSAVQMIETLGSRLKALHIHDNDKLHDTHKLPYTSNIDFEPIINALSKIGYDGDITFESSNFLPNFPINLFESAARLMCNVGMYFKEEILKRQKKI